MVATNDIANLLPKTVSKAAEFYASRFGWRVFPLYELAGPGVCSCRLGADCPVKNQGKHPRVSIPSGEGAVHPATNDPVQIQKWWKRWPNANIGVWLEGSNLIVLDIDKNSEKDGFAVLGEIMQNAGEQYLPKTLICDTPSGGKHLYFNFVEGVPNHGNSLGPGLDTWHSKHYVIVPPSNHVKGTYVWATQDSPIDFPDWLKPKKKEARPRGRPARERIRANDPEDVERLKHALKFVDNTDREKWVAVGFVIARIFNWSDDGFQIYDDWSRSASNYNAAMTKKQYFVQSKAIPPNPITSGTIFSWAKEHPDFSEWEKPDNRPFVVFEQPDDHPATLYEVAKILPYYPVYQRGPRLVEVVSIANSEPDDSGIWRPKGSFMLRNVDAGQFASRILPVQARWMLKGKTGWKAGPVTREISSVFLGIGNWPSAKKLRAFVQHPTLRDDGTVLAERGYDEKSGLFLTDKIDVKIPPKPSARDVKNALKTLQTPFREFSWIDGSISEAALMASLFTVGIRHLFEEGVPMFAVDAPRQGSGKTKIVRTISTIWFGHSMATTPYSADPEEMKKHLAAMLLNGDRMILFDNVHPMVKVNDPTLNALLTNGRSTFRELGSQRMLDLDSTATFFMTGNNLKIVGDMIRRTIKLQIDPGGLHPENRVFKIDPLEAYVLEHRIELLEAALTILVAFHAAKCPAPKTNAAPIASFEKWSALIRNMILWLGLDDVKECIAQGYENDDEAGEIEHLLRRLYEIPQLQGDGLPSALLLPVIENNKALRDAMTPFLHENRYTIDHPRVVTTILSHVAKIPLDGKRLMRIGPVWVVRDNE
jgi:hypothetical protein